jgi:hypothetical protein
MAAVAAEFMRAVKFRQLDPAPRQLEQAHPDPAPGERSHVMAAILADHPHGIALPFANMQRMLADKIEIYRFAMGNSPPGNHNFCS